MLPKAIVSACLALHLPRGQGLVEVPSACLPDAVAPLKEVTVDGETMPIGIWRNGWPSARVASNIFRILVQDVLGYKVVFSAEGQTRYTGLEGTFLGAGTIAKGLNALGLNLKVYSSYNSSTQDPSPFFSSIDDIDTSLLAACDSAAVRNSWRTATVRGFEMYQRTFPGDVDGYYTDAASGEHWPICHGNLWWLAPSCRSNPSKCVPWLTYYPAWRAMEHMQLATLYNMPLAIGFAATEEAYASIPKQHDVLWYWWLPDATFADKDVQRMVFPIDDFVELGDSWEARGIMHEVLDKWVMNGLQAREPQQLAERMKIAPKAMTSMLAAVAAGKDEYTVACDWLKADATNPPWRAWVPRATDCVEGQGWADATDQLVTARSNATQCIWCPAGSVSRYDYRVSGFVCKACSPGQFFDADSCRDCDIGRFSSTSGQTHCSPCEMGTYASTRGVSSCTSCQPGFITQGRGETNSSGCGCAKGMHLGNNKDCVSCAMLHTTESPMAASERDCILDMEQVKQAGLLMFALLCLGAAALAAALFRRYKLIQADEAMQKTLKQGFRSISMPQHPMCLVPFLCFCELDSEEMSQCHEGIRNMGRLLVLDTKRDVDDFKGSGRQVVFFSYTWTSWARSGPNASQLACMKAAAQRLRDMEDIDPEHLYIWLDVIGIPQANDRCKQLAIESLYVYASTSDYLVVICPEGRHEQTAEVVGVDAYKSRTWCRVEQMAHFSCHGLDSMWYSDRPGEITRIDENWLRDVAHIFEGEVTCCRLGHPSRQVCDRQLLVPTVLAMYTVLLKTTRSGASADIEEIWDLMNMNRDRTFPKTFMYNDSGKMRQRQLFGSTVERIQDLVRSNDGPFAHKAPVPRQSVFGHTMSTISWRRAASRLILSRQYQQRSGYIARWLLEAADEAKVGTHRKESEDRSDSFCTKAQTERLESSALSRRSHKAQSMSQVESGQSVLSVEEVVITTVPTSTICRI
eukprot:TRINITY_DN6098_c0_g2_i3.p1 TRINITY_DN6098_c0_g2~~TRINITY_DN6098_c0_g2_i3.p1  ORF type:complete len:972 (+),score=151.84 TRINITY_DN6098_c0_g2_i3:145-3060(+)